MVKAKRLLLVSNYAGDLPDRFKRFEEIFKSVENLEYEIVNFESMRSKNLDEFDLFILSGSPANLIEKEVDERFKNEMEFIQNIEKPILGICFGHQLIGMAFGFKVRRMKDEKIEWDKKEFKLKIKPFELCNKEEIMVEEYHMDEIVYTPELEKVFDILASSENCKVQIIRHKRKKIFGLQFHPETDPDSKIKEDGEEIIKNFIKLC
jgi:GMP synthase (glutamine-hydrolysing)